MDLIILTVGLAVIFVILLFTKTPTGRTSSKWKMTRLAVIRRDHFTCQMCGRNGGYLEVHHIKSWAAYPELRFTMSNLQAICPNCHQQTPSYKYWKSKNN